MGTSMMTWNREKVILPNTLQSSCTAGQKKLLDSVALTIVGEECEECSLSLQDSMVCDILLMRSIEFNQCWNSSVDRDVYTRMCIRAVCAGAGQKAACLALEAFSAACQAKGIPVEPWRENTPCALQCPDRSSPGKCVDSSSNSCPALLRPGSSAPGCSEGCQCHYGNVFDGGECVPYSQCGCVLHDLYIKMDEQLYTEDCTQRCWCHPLSGVICEEAGCSTGQQCALRNGSWGCHDKPEVCELRSSLQVSTLSGQQLILEPQLSYSLVSLCDEASVQWFSVISYHGPCDGQLFQTCHCVSNPFAWIIICHTGWHSEAEWTLCIPPTHFAIRGVFVIWCEPG
ncbi:IgGFc-binding protein Fcgamma-binding protein antigen [Larimichthys crocea]|uniref:IgGFc-binding protein Fcgamma-binding protein antigen n=1 Tax=Larimichthys crocea TaxID=215358 RepID=A0A6G0IB65_LARCR|nr:IgGFc-binding protein Fcgamma-binding protein antigen [Larimichthys crocea]